MTLVPVDNTIQRNKMDFNNYARKPFFVEAVKVTEENIEEIAELAGTLRRKPDGQVYIQVDRRKVRNVFRVFPGFWMTRMGDHIRFYAGRIFEEQFVPSNDEIVSWVDTLNGHNNEKEEDAEVSS